MRTLIILEHNNLECASINRSTITAASKIGAPIDFIILGSGCQEVAITAANYRVAERVYVANSQHLEHQLAEESAATIISLVNDIGYSHILVAATTTGKNLLPRVAALLDAQPVSDVMSVLSPDTFKRPIYAGNTIATIKVLDPIICISVRTALFDPVVDGSVSTSVESLRVGAAVGISECIKEELSASDRPDLSAANIILSGGRGLASADNFGQLYRLADLLGGAVGASRAAVDAGFAPNDLQVGQTGKIVSPELYIAVGISGAIQHLAGMKDSKVIVAINKDEDAPIFQVADYGLVADLFDALPELEALLS